MKKIIKPLTLLSCAMLIAACNDNKKEEVTPMETTVSQQLEQPEIVNTYWKLIELDGKEVVMTPDQEREQYFILNADNTISGFGGCNYFNGTYTLPDAMSITVENLSSTMKSCQDTNENEFLEVFNIANNYTISNKKLFLNIGKRAPLAVFEQVHF